MNEYLNPGCKLTAINGESVKGLGYHEMITRLERAKTSVVLSIEEPTGFLLEGSCLPSRNTWPLVTEHECVYKSLGEGQIHYPYNSKPCMPLSVSGSMPPASDYNTEFNNEASISPCCRSIHQEPCSPLLVPSVPHDRETPTDQDTPASQACLPNTTLDKRKLTIDHIPRKIFHLLCTKLDTLSCLYDDYRLLADELKFPPQEISILMSGKEPTCELLNTWFKRKGDEATVEVLLGVFQKMERQDLLQLLQSWVENCAK